MPQKWERGKTVVQMKSGTQKKVDPGHDEGPDINEQKVAVVHTDSLFFSGQDQRETSWGPVRFLPTNG